MQFLKKIFKSSNFWPLVIVVVFAVLAGRSLIFEKGFFNMHDDLQMMRQLEMEKCLVDGQIPCRWVPDMGYGYGFPLFNFYPPLPYLIGEVFRTLQFSFVDTVKLTFALSFVLSGITMYFLAKEFFGRWGGIVSSIFYIWAPYHSVDIYVRGAMNEAWALVWFPLILWTSYRLIQESKKSYMWIISLAISWAGLLLSHNLMVLIFTPVFAGWCLIFWIKEHNIKKFFQLVFSGVFALGLSAFFTLPAVLEQKLIHVDTLTQGYYEYIAHYATIGQLLFSRFWGYGASVWGVNDGMSFQVGQVHWILSLIILAYAVVAFINRKKSGIKVDILYSLFFAIGVAWFAAFMVHQNSTFLWQKIPFLAFVQFPWRFLALVILGFSFAAGSIVIFLKPYGKLNIIVPAFLLEILLIINWNYFLPFNGKMGNLTDAQKFTGKAWNLQRTAGIFDYLPETAKQNPKDPQIAVAEVINGKGVIENASQGTNWAKFSAKLMTDSVIRVDLYQFPTWKITIDGEPVQAYIPETEVYGRMFLNISKGAHEVTLKLENTPIRNTSNIISVASWLMLLTFPIWGKKMKNSKTV